jgi:hypothetical protein
VLVINIKYNLGVLIMINKFKAHNHYTFCPLDKKQLIVEVIASSFKEALDCMRKNEKGSFEVVEQGKVTIYTF